MDIEVQNDVPQTGRYTLRLVPLDDENAPTIEWPSNPHQLQWSRESQWEAYNTAGARWDGQSDASAWTGNRPRRWTWEAHLASIYDEDGPFGLEDRRVARLVDALDGLMRLPTERTGAPSRVRVEHGEAPRFVASLVNLTVDSQQFDERGLLIAARVQLELVEQPEDASIANTASDPAFDDWEW